MEFPFHIHSVLPNEITLVDNRLMPARHTAANQMQNHQHLRTVVDKMGAASAKAQGLMTVITSSDRLAYTDHHLYILKDDQSVNGKGSVVGIIKVGHKKLFVYDHHGNHHEMEPLCVLDFYVHESRQRKGSGKKLFEYMIQAEKIKPSHLAIDRPSHKFLAFLGKHYHLKATIPQVNNFVVFDGFFRERSESRRKQHGSKPPLHPYRRHGYDARQDLTQPPNEPPNNTRHQSGRFTDPAHVKNEREAFKDVPLPRTNIAERQSSAGSTGRRSSAMRERTASPAALAAQQSNYSRHNPSPTMPADPALDLPAPTETTTRIQKTTRKSSPPMLRRDGPSKDFLQLNGLTHHREYQDNRGRLRVTQPPGSSSNSNDRNSRSAVPTRTHNENTYSNLPPGNPYTSKSAKPRVGIDSTWNIFGVPSQSRMGSSNHHQQTRLW